MRSRRSLALILFLALLAAAPAPASIPRRDFPGGWYAELLPSGHWFVLIRDSHFETSFGRVELPPGGNLAQPRLDPVTGRKIAGVGIADDIVWEWDGRVWVNKEKGFGTRAVVYDRFGNLKIVRGPGTETGSIGYRYADGAQLVTSESTYADSIRGIWEFTDRVCAGVPITIGQGGDDEGVQGLVRGRRILIDPGENRFINFDCSGAQTGIAWTNQQPWQRATTYGPTVAELEAWPTYTPPGPQPQPVPEPEPEPEPQPSFPERLKNGERLKDVVERELEATRLLGKGADDQARRDNAARAVAVVAAKLNAIEGAEVYGLRSKHRAGWSNLPLRAGGTIGVFSDLLAYRDPFISIDVVSSAEAPDAGTAWTNEEVVTDHRHRFVSPSELALDGVPPPPPPEDVAALKRRIADLETELETLRGEHNGALDTIHTLERRAQELETEKAALEARVRDLENTPDGNPCDRVRIVGGPGWIRSLFGIRCEPLEPRGDGQ